MKRPILRLFLLLVAAAATATCGKGGLPSPSGLLESVSESRRVRSVLPIVSGVSEDQEVFLLSNDAENGKKIGEVEGFENVTDGVLVTIKINSGVELRENSRVILRPSPRRGDARLEIRSSSFGATLGLPALLTGMVVPGNPDGFLEPAPRWPSGGLASGR